MTTTPDVVRPPDVDPRRWYDPRTPWYARKKASDAHRRANRPQDVTYADHTGGRGSPSKTSTAELLELVPRLFDQGMTAEEISAEVGIGVDALRGRFANAERPDLALPFIRARNEQRRNVPCAGCGTATFTGRCRSCAAKGAS